jgi:hypothetical protein
MKGSCSLKDCGLHEGLGCEMGHSDFTQCPHFEEKQPQAINAAAPPDIGITNSDDGQRLPWTGRAIGLSDILLVSGRSSCDLIGLVGPHNAGKTAFLTALFAHFSKLGNVDGYSFAGSYSLSAWAHLKQYTQWPATNGPCFPPHTPLSGERVPSLLHLAFRQPASSVRDILFTDAPGEWFSQWIRQQAADQSRGARWIVDNASQFIFFIDRTALAGTEVGKCRQETIALARLLAENRNGRPVIVVWSKSDLPHAGEIEVPIRRKLEELFGKHPTFNLHVKDSACMNVLTLLLKPERRLLDVSRRRVHAETGSAFLAYRGEGV